MSDERRKQELGEEDFDGRNEVIEEIGEAGGSESSSESEEGEGEASGEEGENYSEENDGESVFVSSPNKRIKEDENRIDRLSALPDCLLIQILSRIWCMKKVATTSVLSKRWQNLWTEFPRLRFRENSYDVEKTRNLVSRVNRTLGHRTGNYLNEFEIHFAYAKCYVSDVDAWVEFAVKNKVKQLSLELHSCKDDFYLLPQVMYSCSSLTGLSMRGCIVAPERTIDWKSLLYLTIKNVELHDDLIHKILLGCPVLRSLCLISCWGFGCLDIVSERLHSLSILDYDDGKTGSPLLEISAPHLLYLYIRGFPIDKKMLRLRNSESIYEAEIDICFVSPVEEIIVNVMEFFESIQHVESLELGCLFVKVLCELVANGWQLPYSLRKYLKVETSRDVDSFSCIIALLESSPYLETLVVQCHGVYEEFMGTLGPVAKVDLDFDLMHLETVELIEYADPKLGGEPLLTLARILLKRAPALETMVIDGNLKGCSPLDSLMISQGLLSYPRSSQNAIIIFSQ